MPGKKKKINIFHIQLNKCTFSYQVHTKLGCYLFVCFFVVVIFFFFFLGGVGGKK